MKKRRSANIAGETLGWVPFRGPTVLGYTQSAGDFVLFRWKKKGGGQPNLDPLWRYSATPQYSDLRSRDDKRSLGGSSRSLGRLFARLDTLGMDREIRPITSVDSTGSQTKCLAPGGDDARVRPCGLSPAPGSIPSKCADSLVLNKPDQVAPRISRLAGD